MVVAIYDYVLYDNMCTCRIWIDEENVWKRILKAKKIRFIDPKRTKELQESMRDHGRASTYFGIR